MRGKSGRAKEIPPFPNWEDAVPFPKVRGTTPVVFMFQPKRYKVVSTPEELRLWEKMMIEHVGMKRKRGRMRGGRMRGRETISGKAPMTMDD